MNTTEYRSILEQLKKELSNQLLPVGCIMMFPNEKVPDGFMPCDGRELPIVSYPELYAVIGQTFKPTEQSPLELYKKGKMAKSMSASKTVFHLPDMRGQFVRGWDQEHNVDSDTDRKFGGLQEDAFQGHAHEVATGVKTSEEGSHNHGVYTYDSDIQYGRNTWNADYTSHCIHELISFNNFLEKKYGKYYNYCKEYYNSYYSSSNGSHSHTIELPKNIVKNPTSSTYGEVCDHVSTETRPKNIALTFCIKVK